MTNVFVEPRPKGRPEGSSITDFVVEDHATVPRPARVLPPVAGDQAEPPACFD
jgi:hypothetical protein